MHAGPALHYILLLLHTAMDHPPQPHDDNVKLLKKEILGSGSYGVVCKAMHGKHLCAAKLLHPIFFQSNDPGTVTTRRRFEQECHFLNDMKHPNIVEYLGTTHDPETDLLVLLMELMDESLTHFLERSQQPLAYHTEVDLCHDIAQALAYIHSKEIIHRDLSGNNVLLITGKAKITDFGMSKLLDKNRRKTSLTTCPGTLVYMPPEALRDPPAYCKKIDCFSFGVLQIQIMTRQFPDPGPARQIIEDSRSPTGTMEMPILESERRKSHIKLIDPTHTLLPTALSCLSYLEKDRPTAQDLCQHLAAFKETSCYIQSVEIQQLHQQLVASNSCMHSLQQQLQTKDQQLYESQRHIDTLQQELQTKDQEIQDSQKCMQTLQQELQEQNQHLAQKVEEKQHMIEDRETQLQLLNQKQQANEQVTVELQRNLLQHEQTNKQLQETVGQLRQDLQQAVEEKQDGKRQLWELKQQLQKTEQIEVQTATRKALVKQKIIQDMTWEIESEAPEEMRRGSAASDSNVAYFNGGGSTKVHSYDSDTQKWHQLPDTPHTWTTLVVVQHILTMVGGYLSGKVTNSLLSLMGGGRAMKWLPNFPSMPTARYLTAAICTGHSLIVAGGYGCYNRLATVEVLNTDTQQWSTACSLPQPISSATISICGQQLYMMGGYQTGQTRSVITCSIPEVLQSSD